MVMEVPNLYCKKSITKISWNDPGYERIIAQWNVPELNIIQCKNIVYYSKLRSSDALSGKVHVGQENS